MQNNSSLIPSPSRPDPVSSAGRSVSLLSAAYLYGIFPLIPTFKTVASLDWEVEEGFGKWWGVYCIDRSSWFRIGEPALPSCRGSRVLIQSAIYHPSPTSGPISHLMCGCILISLFER